MKNHITKILMMTAIMALAAVFGMAQELNESYFAAKGIQKKQAKQNQTANGVAPSNDSFTNAIELSLLSGTTSVSGGNMSASKETNEPNHADNVGGASVWYKYTPTQTRVVRFTALSADFDTLLGIYTGNSVGALELIGSSDDVSGVDNSGSQVDSMLVAGTTYYIAVDGYDGALPEGTFSLSVTEGSAPENDNLSNAVDLGSIGKGIVGGTNLNATREADETNTYPNIIGDKTVWYKWKPGYSHSVRFELTENFNSVIEVYEANVQNPTFNQLNDVINTQIVDYYSEDNSRYRAKFFAQSGKTYYIVVANHTAEGNSQEGNFQMRFSDNPLRYSTDFYAINEKASLSLFRPSEGAWYTLDSYQYSSYLYRKWGLNGDTSIPADFNGDGFTERCVVRNEGNAKIWYINGNFGSDSVINWGLASDTPVVGDFDLDGRADLTAIRNTPNGYVWYIRRSANGALKTFHWGIAGDKPVLGDFDGDGATDVAVTRNTQAGLVWYILKSGYYTENPPYSQTTILQWGIDGDLNAVEDYDGDGKTDIAIFRPSTGTFYIMRSGTGQIQVTQFGSNGDIPQPADYDGDGKADLAVFRPSEGVWYIAKPDGVPAQNFYAIHFGLGTDKPVSSLTSLTQ